MALISNYFRKSLNVVINVPQYYTPKAIITCRTGDEYWGGKLAIMKIPVKPGVVELERCIKTVRDSEGVVTVARVRNDDDCIVLKKKNNFSSAVFLNADDSPAEYKDLCNKEATMLVQLLVRGFGCEDGHAYLDIRLVKCKFLNTNGPSKVVLQFTLQKPLATAPPRHFIESVFSLLPDAQRVCAICTDVIGTSHDNGLGMTSCYHYFHLACIAGVLDKKCPTCRANL